jgi:hypothetical protein
MSAQKVERVKIRAGPAPARRPSADRRESKEFLAGYWRVDLGQWLKAQSAPPPANLSPPGPKLAE